MAQNMSQSQEWRREFRELGPDRVRSSLATGKWDRDKRAAARLWIEAFDAQAWQRKRGSDGTSSPSLILRLRGAKWWRYAAAIIVGLMGLGLMWRRMGF